MKKVLVTGAGGQLAESIRTLHNKPDNISLSFTGISDLDLTDKEKTISFFSSNRFDFIINCAAYTAVDHAEKDAAGAYAVNADVPATLGDIALEHDCRLIHISTDYVFDGLSPYPYTEISPANPLSIYGKSKLAGEDVLLYNPNAVIIRTSWLYSEFGHNFLKTIIRLGKEKESVGVVYDQTGCPTYAPDLAEILLKIIYNTGETGFPSGIYHYCNDGIASWFDLAWEILEITGLKCRVRPVTTEEYPLPATRPRYSVLNTSRIRTDLGISTVHWKTSLKKAIARIGKI